MGDKTTANRRELHDREAQNLLMSWRAQLAEAHRLGRMAAGAGIPASSNPFQSLSGGSQALHRHWSEGHVAALLEARQAESAEARAARATLERMGYTWEGGELWKPPLGAKTPAAGLRTLWREHSVEEGGPRVCGVCQGRRYIGEPRLVCPMVVGGDRVSTALQYIAEACPVCSGGS